MEFWFQVEDEKLTFMSMKSLMNKNNGFFKSEKQASFLFKQYTRIFNTIHTHQQVQENFAVPVEEGQVTVECTAYTRWADYGTRSIVPVIFLFVIDKLGVVAHYKIRGNGNLRDGWGPDPKKTQIVWQRNADAVCPFSFTTEEQNIDKIESKWIGAVGERVEVSLTLVKAREVGYSRFGPTFLSVFKDAAGNIVNIWKAFTDLDVGSTVKISGKVKSLDEYRGARQTTLSYVKFV